MSYPAEDRLFALIAHIPGSGAMDWCDEARRLIDEIRDEHANDLAEEIREASLGMYPTGLCPAISGSRQAANLIDPYVSTPEYLIETAARHLAEWEAAEE
ncbi:hypothetical protein ACFWNC_14670 [Streptomyces sp. NPDC058369]|uniref:hypothetical protein n=1 Tax=Streptomyces sp. NPDC058369 TaxID=3346462 RepID=UPI00364AA8AB